MIAEGVAKEPPTEVWSPSEDEPQRILRAAVDATREAFATMVELELLPVGDSGPPDRELADAAGCISLTTANGGWNVAVSGSHDSCRRLAIAMMGMEEDEPVEPEMVSDALGEVVNLVAGSIKSIASEAAGARLGLPMYVEGSGWFERAPTGSRFAARKLAAESIHVQVVICWREA